MLLIKTYIKSSPIHGLGLFTKEFIPKGTVIWEYNSLVDKSISNYDKISLPKLTQEFIEFFYYFKKDFGWTILGDNARFINHSTIPNTDSKEFFSTIANRDIQIDEEIFENYYDFNDNQEDNYK